MSYIAERNGRGSMVYTRNRTITIDNTCTLNMELKLPTVIFPEYWARHHLSREDIVTILNCLPTNYLWLGYILCGGECPWSFVKPSFAYPHEVIVTGKKTVISHLLKKATHDIDQVCDSILYQPVGGTEHIPPLPRHTVPYTDYEFLSHNINPHLIPREFQDPEYPPHVSGTYSLYGLDWIATSLDGDSICLTRVIAESDFRMFRTSPAYVPCVGIYKNHAYALTDESMYVTPV
jgi:hypothetical protein